MKTIKAMLLLTAITLSVLTPSLSAQDPAKTQDAIRKPVTAYRLNFSMNELDGGKKINSRQYSLNLNAGDGNELKIGTRVPVEAKQGEFQYIDVGTNIWCKITETAEGLVLDVRSDFSNFAVPDQQNHTTMPILRQFTIRGSTVAIPGKPTSVGSVDDPNSSHEFQLEVTATKL